jgi:UPF0716 protein FxsA
MNIGRLLLISLISLPFLEIYLIIKLAGSLGFFLCLTLIIASALAGIALIRVQGTTALVRAQQAIAQGQLRDHRQRHHGLGRSTFDYSRLYQRYRRFDLPDALIPGLVD